MDNFKNIKIGLVGDANIGKSCFIDYIKNEPFIKKYSPTIGVDLKVLYLDNLKLKFTFWDLSGQYLFKELVDTFVNSLNVICFCFAVDNIDSYNYMLNKYNQYLENNVLKDKLCIVLQLKCDTIHNIDICKNFSEENQIKTIATSTLKGFGKEDLLFYLLEIFSEKINNDYDVQIKEKEKTCIIN
jgi:small GTP-binding protein